MKTSILLLILCLLVGCGNPATLTEGTTIIKNDNGGKNVTVPDETTPEESSESAIVTAIGGSEEQKTIDYHFEVQGIAIKPTEKYELIHSDLPEPLETGEAPSCAFEGLDTLYVFDGFDVQCGLIRGEEIITGVFFTDEKTATPEGLRVGMTIDEMIQLYGTDFSEDFGKYTYSGETVDFIVVGEEGKVLTISYIGHFE